MALTIRDATLADLGTIQHHRDSMFLDMGIAPDVVSAASAPARAWVATRLEQGSYHGLLAMDGESIVGGCGVTWLDLPPNMHTLSARRGYVLNMYVEPDHRRRGLARQLIEAALTICRREGVDVVSLHASDAGLPLYEDLGFTVSNEMRLIF